MTFHNARGKGSPTAILGGEEAKGEKLTKDSPLIRNLKFLGEEAVGISTKALQQRWLAKLRDHIGSTRCVCTPSGSFENLPGIGQRHKELP